MSLRLILVFGMAAAIGSYPIKSDAAQSDSETLQMKVNFAQVFADVEAATANFDREWASAFRHKLYKAALKRINAITYEEWLSAIEAKTMRRPTATPIESE